MDRRVRKSKDSIKEAFTTLMNDVGFDQITVRSLCKEADINRSTFYLHYKNIDDLFLSFESSIAEHITLSINHIETDDLVSNPTTLTRLFTHIIQAIEEDSDLALALINHSEASSIKITIEQVIENLILERIENEDFYSQEEQLDMPPSYIAVLFSSIFTSLLTEWLIKGTKESPQMLARFINEIAFQPIIQNMFPEESSD